MLWAEFIPDTPDREKMAGAFGIFFEVFSERKDEIVNGSRGRVDVVAPDGLQDLLARNHLVFALHEELEEHGLFFGQHERPIIAGGLEGGKIDMIVAKSVLLQFDFSFFAGAAQQIVHPQ